MFGKNHVFEAIYETGNYLFSNFKQIDPDLIEEKSKNQLVTFVDKTAESMLIKSFSAILPQSNFISEEWHSQTELQNLTWIIDPLDGTTNFLHGIPIFSISVALYENGNPIFAAIYDVPNQKMYYADEEGAFCNQKPIKVSNKNLLSQSILATGFPYYDFIQMEAYINTLKYLMQHSHGLRRMGSAAIDLAMVAEGVFDGFFEYGLAPWDVAAGAFIVEKAGGITFDFRKENNCIFGKQIIAGNISISNDLQKIISQHFS